MQRRSREHLSDLRDRRRQRDPSYDPITEVGGRLLLEGGGEQGADLELGFFSVGHAQRPIIEVETSGKKSGSPGPIPCTDGEVYIARVMLRRLRVVSLIGLAALACSSSSKPSGDAPADAKSAEAKTAEAPADGKAAEGKAEGGLAGKVQEKATELRAGDEAGAAEGGEGAPDAPVGASGEVIAKVGAVEIPKSEFSSIYDLKVKKYVDRGREIPKTAARRYRKSILDRITYQEALRQEADAKGVTYDKKALAKREAQQKRGIRDWAKHLDRRGETEESLRNMYVSELLEVALLEKAKKLDVPRSEIEADYEKIKGNWKSDQERVRASHILIPTSAPEGAPPISEADAKKKAQEIYEEAILPGADFAELARTHSTGPSASKGGDIGIFTEDRMAEEFSKVAFAMKPGEISKPVKTKFGWHVIKVVGKWPSGELPIEALEDQIVDRLRQRKLHQGRRELKEELMGRIEVYWFLDLDTGTMLAKGVDPEMIEPRERRRHTEHDEGKAGRQGGCQGRRKGAVAQSKPSWRPASMSSASERWVSGSCSW